MEIGNIGQEKINQVKNLPLFNHLEESDISAMLKHGDIIRLIIYEDNETVIKQNSHDRKIFVLLDGRVEVTREVMAGDVKKKEVLNTIDKKGQHLGEISALTGKLRTATVRTLVRTVFVVLDIDMLLNSSSEIADRVKSMLYPKLFEILCFRMDETNEHLARAMQKCEELEKEIIRLRTEKLEMKIEYEEKLGEKVHEIKNLEKTIEKIT